MNLWKRIASVSLMFTVIISSMLSMRNMIAFTEPTEVEHVDSLTVKCKGGTILHAWNWRFKDIEEHIDEIKAAGYKSVQVSPIQKEKKVEGKASSLLSNWWILYQPINFKIGNVLGTEDDFKKMCKAAHDRDIKIIVDVVTNHLANESDQKYEISSQVEGELKNPDFWHNIKEDANDDSRFNMTQRSIGMPDLNTGNEELQKIIGDFLNSCQDCGADGFRFDAAKHIELPKYMDGESGSDYWPNIIKRIKDKDEDAFIYGEVLNPTDTIAKNYTEFMPITADKYGNNVRDAVIKGIAGYAWSFGPDISPDKLVTWVESHDNYANNGGYGESSNLTDTQIKLGWSLVAGRASATPLFFVRPNSGLEGEIGDIDNTRNKLWKDSTIVAINKFHNEMSDRGEYVRTPSHEVFVVERGENAAILTNISKEQVKVDIETNLKEGFYWDEISGKKPENNADNKFSVKEIDGKRHLIGTMSPESTAILRIA